jgi:hypothetical protein
VEAGFSAAHILTNANSLMQNGADLCPDQPLGHLAKVQVQDGFEGACHVGGCGKEFGQARIGFQLPPKVSPNLISGPMAVGMLTGEYRPSIHGPVLPCALSLAFDISDYAGQRSRIGQATGQFCAGFVQVSIGGQLSSGAKLQDPSLEGSADGYGCKVNILSCEDPEAGQVPGRRRRARAARLLLLGAGNAQDRAVACFECWPGDREQRLRGRNLQAPPVSVGRSVLVDPMGYVEADLGLEPGVRTVEVSLGTVARVREQFPMFRQRRPG